MASEVDICNMALSYIRAASINSLTENSLQAQYCKLHYPQARNQMLQDYPWQFAHKIAPLAEIDHSTINNGDGIFNYAYAYQYPADCIKINRAIIDFRRVQPGDDNFLSYSGYPFGYGYGDDSFYRNVVNFKEQIPFDIVNYEGNRLIVSNHPRLRLDYQSEVTDTNLFGAQFTDALAYLLASRLAIPVVGAEQGMSLRNANLQIYTELYAAAIASDANDQFTDVPDSEYVTTRF